MERPKDLESRRGTFYQKINTNPSGIQGLHGDFLWDLGPSRHKTGSVGDLLGEPSLNGRSSMDLGSPTNCS